MKKSKILAPALAVLCLSVAASVTGTVAWFAANNVVTATGMTIKSNTPSSLVIGKTIAAEGGIGTAVTISWADAAVPLNPCSTYDGGADVENGSLYYVTNGQDVSPATGLAYVSGETNPQTNEEYTELTAPTLSYGAVTIASSFYKDYVAYIGSFGSAITISASGSLSVAIDFGSTSDTTKATSVDFWVCNNATSGTTDLGLWKGTLNAAGLTASSNHGDYDPTATTSSLELLGAAGIIPVGSGTTGLKVVMRMYFDGALQDSASSAYVKNDTLSTASVAINATFSLTR